MSLLKGYFITYKVGETKNFAVELAKELDMKIAPSNILDIALGYFLSMYTMYYLLEDEAVNTIIQTLNKW